MFKTVKVSVTAERNWGDVNLLSRVGFWLMLRKMCLCYKHPEDMIRIVDVGFFLWPQHFNKIVRETTCDGCIACVTFFLHETSLLLVSLFYGKYYVTMFIREYVAFSYRYWGKFLPKQNEKKLSQIMFFHRKRRFFLFFLFLRFSNRFFLSVSFRYILYFFWFVNDLTDFVGFAIYFFFIVMKRHNRFFWIGDFCFIPAGRSQTMGVVT